MKTYLKAIVRAVLAVALLTAWAGPAAAQGSMFQALYPRLATMQAPAWLKPGMRLTFYTSAASIPGSRYYYWQHPQGDYTKRGDPHGDKYKRGETRGPGGHGYLNVDVVALTGNTAVVSLQNWVINPATNKITPRGLTSFISPASDGNGFWLPPGLLGGVRNSRTANLEILCGPYRLKTGGERQAVYYRSLGNNSQLVFIFDKLTGLLLSTYTSAVSKVNPIIGGPPTPPDQMTTRKGVSQATFVARRMRPMPWQGAPPPPWLNTVREMHYRGTSSMGAAGAPPITNPLYYSVRVTRRGQGWIGYRAVAGQPAQGPMPPTRIEVEQVSGPAQVGGLWLPPVGMARLRPGVVLDRDPVTGVSQRVLSIGPMRGGGRLLVIREEGQAHVTDFGYDAIKGMMVFLKTTVRSGLGYTTTNLNLVNMQ